MTASDDAERLALALQALSVVRHDLRNLLASVTILADRMQASGDERLAKAAPLLLASMERTVALGVRSGQLAEAAAAGPTASPVTGALAVADPDGRARAEGAETSVKADPAQLGVILAELLANAFAASEAVHVAVEARGPRVQLRVRDEGGGIPDYAVADLFTPFKGAKRRDGTGLGLPIAARLARLNGGTLTLEETGPGGTTFLLELPSA